MPAAANQHVFISYVRDDAASVDRLCAALAAAHIPYWRDRDSLSPGDHWKSTIRSAIRTNSVVFLACFSQQSVGRAKSYMNEELVLAVDEYRQRPPDTAWLIPVRFDDCPIPEWDLGGGRMLSDLNYVDLFGDALMEQTVKLVLTVSKLFVRDTPSLEELDAAVDAIEPVRGDEPPGQSSPNPVGDVPPTPGTTPAHSKARLNRFIADRPTDPYGVILGPVVSEKSFASMKDNEYAFIVRPNSNKTEIKTAIEKLFKVKVARVNTSNSAGKRKSAKRAIVTLASGEKPIDIFGIGT
jgi:ribosomal protein L23